jgi:hypothetical protein
MRRDSRHTLRFERRNLLVAEYEETVKMLQLLWRSDGVGVPCFARVSTETTFPTPKLEPIFFEAAMSRYRDTPDPVRLTVISEVKGPHTLTPYSRLTELERERLFGDWLRSCLQATQSYLTDRGWIFLNHMTELR